MQDISFEEYEHIFKKYGWLTFKTNLKDIDKGFKKAFIYNKITKNYINQQLDLFEYEPDVIFCEFSFAFNWYSIPVRKVLNKFELTSKLIINWKKLTLKELESLLQSIELEFKKFINELEIEKLEREFNE